LLRWVTDGNPYVVTDAQALAPGQYVLHEAEVPSGYDLAEDVSFSITGNEQQTVTVRMEDKLLRVNVLVEKIWNDNNNHGGAGTRPELVEVVLLADGVAVDTAILSPPEWRHTWENLPQMANGKDIVYTVQEVNVPEGYVSSVEVTPPEAGSGSNLYQIAITNSSAHVVIEKRDALSGNPVAGAQLTLLDNVTMRVVAQWITTLEAREFIGTLIPGREYTLSETVTPAGHYTAEPITFEVTEGLEKITITMVDPKVQVVVSKVDENGELLGGVELALYEGETGSGEILYSWNTSEFNPHTITYPLVEGATYTIREISGPDGYFYAPNVTFTVPKASEQNWIVPPIEITMRDPLTRVAIYKYDQQTGQQLSGVRLSLLDSAGRVVESWVTNGTPHILNGKLIAGDTYTLREDAALPGFVLPSPGTFTVPLKPEPGMPGITQDGNMLVYNVRMENTHFYRFLKIDATTGSNLAGATLYIRDLQGQVVVSDWVTSDTFHEIWGILVPGRTYELVERAAPNGYLLANPVRFTVGANGSLAMITMANRRTPVITGGPTPTPTFIDITVNKIWQDNGNATGERPDTITLYLYRKLTTEASYPSVPYQTATMSGAGNNWTHTFTSLPERENRVRYDYLVQEARVPGYTASYAEGGRTITNSLGEEPTVTPLATATTSIDGGTTGRPPEGMQFIDGEWVYIDPIGIPLGGIPLTGDNANWPLWIAAAVLPLLGIGVALFEIRRRGGGKKRVSKDIPSRRRI
jgi:uncharacterized surface anchored protein